MRPPPFPHGAPALRGVVRANGLAVLFGIVVLGLATGAGFYRWKRGEANARVAAEMAAAPETPAERLELWLRLSGPQIHHRLAVFGRFTPEMPWLVTHARAAPSGEPGKSGESEELELFGVVCADLPKDLARIDGMTVVVELPAPRPLGRATLAGERASRVPVIPEGADDGAEERLSSLALYLLEGIPRALERDVPGAHLEIRVADPR